MSRGTDTNDWKACLSWPKLHIPVYLYGITRDASNRRFIKHNSNPSINVNNRSCALLIKSPKLFLQQPA